MEIGLKNISHLTLSDFCGDGDAYSGSRKTSGLIFNEFSLYWLDREIPFKICCCFSCYSFHGL